MNTALENNLFRVNFCSPGCYLEATKLIGPQVIVVMLSHLISERRISNNARKFGLRIVQARIDEDRIKTGAISFDIRVSIVMKQEIDFANSGQDFMNFNTVHMT